MTNLLRQPTRDILVALFRRVDAPADITAALVSRELWHRAASHASPYLRHPR